MRSPAAVVTLLVGALALLGGSADAHLSDSFWAAIAVGTAVVHSPDSAPPPCVPSASNGSAPSAGDCAPRRLMAAASGTGSEIDKISGFLGTLTSSVTDFSSVGASLKSLNFRSLSPAVVKADTTEEQSLKTQLDNNKKQVDAVVTNLQHLPDVLDRALRLSSLRDMVSTVPTAWSAISANTVKGCGLYKGLFPKRLSDLAAFDLSFDHDDDFKALHACVQIVLIAMASLTEMRQMCDVFHAIDPAADVRLMYDVLIAAANVKKASDTDLKDAKKAVSENPSSFKDGSNAFKDKMTDLLKSKTDVNDAAADLLKSDAWRMAVNGNSAAADAGTQLTASILTRHNEFSDKLTNLEGDITTTANERLAEIGKVDSKIDELHQQKMGQMSSMSTKFAGQHDQRMGRLTTIDGRVQGITTQAKDGFAKIANKLDSLQNNLYSVIDGVASVVKDDAALTTRELKQSLAEAFQQTQDKIGSIDGKLDGQAAAVQDALANTKLSLQSNFEQTNAVLQSASAQMTTLVTSSFEVIKSSIVDAARQTQDIVSSRVIANGARLSEQLVEFDKKIEYVDGRLEVLSDQVATLEDKLVVTNAILQDLAASVEVVAVGLEDLISDIKEIFFQKTFQDLTDRYSSLRSNYKSVLGAPDDSETMSSLKLSCQQARANDLFLSFLNLVDIEDEQIPKQLESFKSDPTKYQYFGMQVITVLDELSQLATLCSGLLFRDDMTEEDLRRKANENARLIRQAARQFTRHVDEVVPAYMIRQRVRDELEKASTQELGGTPEVRAQRVRAIQTRLQTNIGSFAQLTVLAAPKGSAITVNHLEEQYPAVDLSNIRRYGMMVSANKVMAVVWGTTRQLPASETLDKDVLLRQGIYRGSLSAPADCTVAQDATFYPRCSGCVCDHFEDFASTTSAASGRVVTILNSTSIDSDFAVAAVFDAHVDYFMEQIRLDVALDTPGLGAIKADVLDKQRRSQPRVLWEGFSENGKFHVVPGDVKGTLLATNELTLTLSYGASAGATAFRRVMPLFCNGRAQQVQYDAIATLTYQCRENFRKALGDGSEAIVARGLLANRLDTAVCVESAAASSGTLMDCRVTGGFDAIDGDVAALHIGRYVRDVTVYAGPAKGGDFVVCKQCEPRELLATVAAIKSIALESPDEQLLPFLASDCEKVSDSLLVCTK